MYTVAFGPVPCRPVSFDTVPDMHIVKHVGHRGGTESPECGDLTAQSCRFLDRLIGALLVVAVLLLQVFQISLQPCDPIIQAISTGFLYSRFLLRGDPALRLILLSRTQSGDFLFMTLDALGKTLALAGCLGQVHARRLRCSLFRSQAFLQMIDIGF